MKEFNEQVQKVGVVRESNKKVYQGCNKKQQRKDAVTGCKQVGSSKQVQ